MSQLKSDPKAIFLAALECEGAEAQSRFLDEACGADAARGLAGAGADGWETTGLSWPATDGTLVLLKKPR